MHYEPAAGMLGLFFAMIAASSGLDVTAWHCAAAGLTGIFGGWIFINPDNATNRQKFVSIAASAAFASLLGPLLARWVAHENEWVGTANYFVTAAAGLVVGLFSTPCLRLLYNPGPFVEVVKGFLPFWWGKKHGKD